MALAASAPRLSVVLGEPDYLLRQGLASHLASMPAVTIHGVGDDPEELEEHVRAARPQVVVLGPGFAEASTELSGLVERLRAHVPGFGAVLITQDPDAVPIELLPVDAIGVAVVGRDELDNGDRVLQALTEAAEGRTLLGPRAMLRLMRRTRRRDYGLPYHLTPRELEVLRLIAGGNNNTAIATRLVLSSHAVEKHINSIFRKLGLTSIDGLHPRVAAVLKYLTDIRPETESADHPAVIASAPPA